MFVFGSGTIELAGALYETNGDPLGVAFPSSPFMGTDTSDSFITFGSEPLADAGTGARAPIPSDLRFASFPTINSGSPTGFSTGNSTLTLGPVAFNLVALPEGQTDLRGLIDSGRIVSASNRFGLNEESLYLGQISQLGVGQGLSGTDLSVSFADLAAADFTDDTEVDLVNVGTALSRGELTQGYSVIAITSNGVGAAPGSPPITVSQLYLIGWRTCPLDFFAPGMLIGDAFDLAVTLDTTSDGTGDIDAFDMRCVLDELSVPRGD
ncbi:MAG: hypothetical protein AAGI30_14465 [Planctomycetota bacterium]